MIALVLTASRPQRSPAGVEVRQIETYDDFVAAREVQWDAFETPPERREQNRRRFREDFDESMAVGIPVAFLASLDGRPAARPCRSPRSAASS